MKKLLLLSMAAAFGVATASADVAVNQDVTDYWQSLDGKFITITGSRPISNGQYDMASTIPVIGRSVTDTGNADNKLRLLTDYTELNMYWSVEYDEANNGLLLQNTMTGKYICKFPFGGTTILLSPTKTDAAVVRTFVLNVGNDIVSPQYLITTTMIDTAVNPAYNASENTYDTKGASNTNKVWLFCPLTNSDLAGTFAAPNNNSHWDIAVFTPEEALKNFAIKELRVRFASATEEALNSYADRLIADLNAELTTFAEKTTALREAIAALSSEFNFAPLATTGWNGKYLVITGTAENAAGNNNFGRSMFDSEELENLSVKREITGLNKYWTVELDDVYGGSYLKNVATGRYIGTVGKLNNTVIPMQSEKTDQAGVVMIYPRNNVLFVTTAKIRDGENLVDNPNINHNDDIFHGYAAFGEGHNDDDQTKLWMFCTEGSPTDPAAYPVKNYGNGNPNGYWAVSVLSEAEVLTQLAVECIKEQHPDITDEVEINYWAGLVAPAAAALPDKTLAEKYDYVRAETATKRYIAEELDGKRIIIGSLALGEQPRRLSIVDNAMKMPATATDRSHSVWTATYDAEEQGVKLNIDGKYIGRVPDSPTGRFALVDNADDAGCFRFYKLAGQYCLTATKYVNGTAVNPMGHFGAGGVDNPSTNSWMQGLENDMPRWGSNPATSRWVYTTVDDEDLPTAAVAPTVEMAMSGDCHKVTLSHPEGVAKHHALLYETSHVITVTEATAEETVALLAAGDPVHTVAAADVTESENGTLSYSLGRQLPAGTYAVTVPAGMFKVGEDQKSGAAAGLFAVDGDGQTTGIVEINASEVRDDVIYDLQGRRLSAPARGINIINGRKVIR